MARRRAWRIVPTAALHLAALAVMAATTHCAVSAARMTSTSFMTGTGLK